MTDVDVIYEDNHLLVLNKPAGIATMGAESGPTLHSMAVDYIRQKYHKPGKVYLGVVSRLDAMTSGVIVFARTSKSASRLVPQFGETNQKAGKSFPKASKLYLAGVDGELRSSHERLIGFVRKDDQAHRMRVVAENADGAQRAELEYLKVGCIEGVTLLVVRLHTGRKHQIRVQLADQRHPVLGDRKYGSKRDFPAGVALHSWRQRITHPTLKTLRTFVAPPPKSWHRLVETLSINEQLAARAATQFGLDDDASIQERPDGSHE